MPPTIIDLTQASSPAPIAPEIIPVAVLLKQAIADAQPIRLRSTLVAICDTSPEAARIAASLLLVSEEKIRYLSAEESSEEEEQEEEDEDEDEGEEDVGRRSDGNDEASSHNETDKRAKENSRSNHAMGLAANDLKRMRTRYAMCENCDEEFDVAYNSMGDCSWHEGKIVKDLMKSATSASLRSANREVESLDVDYDGDIWADHDERCHGPMDTEENRSQFPEGFIYECCNGDGSAEGCKTGRHVERDKGSKRSRY